MKYKVGTLVVATSKDKKSTAFGLITHVCNDTKNYYIAIQRHSENNKTEWDKGVWPEATIIKWEEEYGYTFAK